MENLYLYNTFDELVTGQAGPQQPVYQERLPTKPLRAICYRGKMLLQYQVEEDWTIEEIIKYAPPIGWWDFFQTVTPRLQNISKQLNGREFFPLKSNLFRAFHLTPLDQVRVVIFGQDPYHDVYNGQPTAQGLAFSIPNGKSLNMSLRNIQKAISNNYPQTQLTGGDLTNWALQGVLLLNKTLTVIPKTPGDLSMEQIWQPFIQDVIRAILRANPNVIFVLWGEAAKKLQLYMQGAQHILTYYHPAARNGEFIYCSHFSQINKILQNMGQSPIDWSIK